MGNILQMKFLQIRKQKMLHILPLLFFYFFLLPYQGQVVIGSDERKALELFILIEKMVIIFSIWYQYLDFQIIFYRDLKDIAFVKFSVSHFKWFIFSKLAYIFLLMPFLLVFQQTGHGYYKNSIAIFMLQIFEVSVVAFLVMELFRSSQIGVIFAAGYFFVCVNRILAGEWNVLVMDVNPYRVGGKWFLVQGTATSVLLVMVVMGAVYRRRGWNYP